MYICHPLKSADASGNESQSQKLEGPNTLGPQVLKSWRGLVPWVPYIHTYIQMCIAPPKIVRTTLRRHRVVVWLCLCLPLWQRLSSVCTTIYRPVGRKCKKVENGGGGFVKKWTFPQRRVHYVQYQYFLFYILLTWGRTSPAYGPDYA